MPRYGFTDTYEVSYVVEADSYEEATWKASTTDAIVEGDGLTFVKTECDWEEGE